VNLARQPSSRTTDVLVTIVRDARSVLVYARDEGIDHLHRRVMNGGQRIHDPVPDARPPPTNEAVVAGRAGFIGLRPREGRREAFTGETTGQVLSCETVQFRGALAAPAGICAGGARRNPCPYRDPHRPAERSTATTGIVTRPPTHAASILQVFIGYCGVPLTARLRNFASLSRSGWSYLKAVELR